MDRPWTHKEIAGRLALSTAVYQRERLSARHMGAIRQAGILQVELSCISGSLDYGNPSQVAEIQRACRQEGLSVVSVHGPFGLPYGSGKEGVRRGVVEESVFAVRFAAEMGARVYVAHFGYQEHGLKTVTEILERTRDLDIVITTENQTAQPFDPYFDAVDRLGSSRFGMVVDIGHARDSDGINPFLKRSAAREALARCGSRLLHVHLHESFDLDQKADHRPPMHPDGRIEWGEVFGGLREAVYEGPLVFEDGRGEDPEEWVRLTAAFPDSFVSVYGSEAS